MIPLFNAALLIIPAMAISRPSPLVAQAPEGAAARWTAKKAQAWMKDRPWPVGCNYVPAYAVNQLEMWQSDTFDRQRIDRELGWAEDLGFNSLRVFLHDLAWKQDPAGFLERMDQFLGAARRHHLSVIFVIFDGVWNPLPQAGPQPAPLPGVHNSQWMQSPGAKLLADQASHRELEAYVKAVLGRFGRDRRILAWDLFNEPDNTNAESYPKTETPEKTALALRLLRQVFTWARTVDPIQPLTCGVWQGDWDQGAGLSQIADFSLANSDIISFHCYEALDPLKAKIAPLRKLNRPLLCTEYMARPRGSRFETILPFLKAAGIGAYNWGFVRGKSQTVYAWDTWNKPQAGEPAEWFHDLLQTDGAPYKREEFENLRALLRGVSVSYGWMPDGASVLQYRLINRHGLICKVITYGGIITELDVPDRTGKNSDIVLGCDRLEDYLKPTPYFGAIVGRVGNRIARGRFSLDGREYNLAVNDGPNHLHGGLRGFDKRIWQARYLETKDGPALELAYRSHDGEEGYPGNLDVSVVYRLTNRDELGIDYQAVTDRDTPVNLTNHTYWNLAGRGTIRGCILTLHAGRYSPVDDTLIPTGAIEPVAGTPMDFTQPKPIGRDLEQLTNQPRGYDHNFVLDPDGKSPGWAAQVYDPSSGRVLEVLTDQPGIQFYTGNFLDGTIRGKAGIVYRQYDAFCLETQHFPDAVNHPNFPSIILHPGETYRTRTTYRFSVRE